MMKALICSNRHTPASIFFTCSLLAGMIALSLQGTNPRVPVPARKPALEMAQTRYGNFIDFSKALTLFAKPTGAAAGKAVASGDIMTYREIFDLQSEGKMAEADGYIAALRDDALIGHVLHQRYTHPDYKTSFNELKDWLARYGDHPKADRIYKLAQARMPAGFRGVLQKPKAAQKIIAVASDGLVTPEKVYKSKRPRFGKAADKTVRVRGRIASLIESGNVTNALDVLMSNPGSFDAVEFDQLRARIAAAYLYKGIIDHAYAQSVPAAQRSGATVPLAGWVAGLTAWKYGRYADSARFFETTARSEYSSGWLASAGAFWAARAYDKTGNKQQYAVMLVEAGKHPRTFYGLMANHLLSTDVNFNWHTPAFTKLYYNTLMATPEGSRAIALVGAGQYARAEDELLNIADAPGDMRDAILAYASYASLPTLAMTLGHGGARKNDSGAFDVALYPRLPWQPAQGYKIDPALVNAIARQESRFDPSAESPSGAMGLMQLMPTTAAAVSIHGSVSEYALKDPENNLELGQRYVRQLLKDPNVDGDIIMMLVAYNAGPGNLARWKKEWPDVQDPLLFIELISSSETRTYVERVLSNYWIYRLQDKRDVTTLADVAAGKPALYLADADRPDLAYSVASR